MKRLIMIFIFSYSCIIGQSIGDIVITEFMSDPANLADVSGEYFEIYNTTESAININGWKIKDDGSNNHTIDNGGPLIIVAGGILVFANDANAALPATVDYVINSSFGLTNTDDEIILTTANDVEIARCNYTDGNNFGDGVAQEIISILTGLDGLVVGPDGGSDFQAATSFLTSGDKGSPGSLGNSALPVILTSFIAYEEFGYVVLKWETATETNNYGFEIERKGTNPLNQAWITLGFVQGSGNSNSPKYYEFIDSNFPPDTLLYRLKQIDTDGVVTYYNQMVKIGVLITNISDGLLPNKFSLSQNYPNPFNPKTMIDYTIPQNKYQEFVITTLYVYDLSGSEVFELVNKQQSAGRYSISFDANHLSSGMYVYQLRSGNFVDTKKLLLLK